jgi:hypothetical protein
MSTLAETQTAGTRVRRAVVIAATSLAVLLAIGTTVVFVVLPGASRSGSAPRQQSAAYSPLIQYRGTGARPTAAGGEITAPRHLKSAYLRAEHSYGAIP